MGKADSGTVFKKERKEKRKKGLRNEWLFADLTENNRTLRQSGQLWETDLHAMPDCPMQTVSLQDKDWCEGCSWVT